MLFVSAFHPAYTQTVDFHSAKTEAERLYAEGSYALAQQCYARLDLARLAPDEARWVRFRLADADWRARAANRQATLQDFEAARTALEDLVKAASRPTERDIVWAEVQVSLGDFWWIRPQSRDWYRAWSHYAAALDWWAHSQDLATARDRYLHILFKAAYAVGNQTWTAEQRVQPLPITTLDEALKLARSDEERAHLHYLTAMRLWQQGNDYESRARVTEEFAAAVAFGQTTTWYDDALFHYGQWLESVGRPVQRPDGTFQMRPDYAAALAQYRQLIAAYRPGTSRYLDKAQQRIADITTPSLVLGVGNVFLPDSAIQFGLQWRNVKQIELALYAIDLTQDLHPTVTDWQGLQRVALSGRKPVKTLSHEGDDRGDHHPGNTLVTLDETLPVGAYLLEARAGKQRARELLLVTDAALVAKADGRRLAVFAASALDGAPIPGMHLRAWHTTYNRRRQAPVWVEQTGVTNQDGLAVFEKANDSGNTTLVLAAAGARQTLCLHSGNTVSPTPADWKIYAFTDRAAYRPGDTARWKIIARQLEGKGYRTPAGSQLGYELLNPRRERVAFGQVTLSHFGGAWGSFTPEATWTLGEYTIRFGTLHAGQKQELETIYGEATLFRLEEYRLPEFRVAVTVPEENGRRKTFRTGDRIELTLTAEYYFGSPVAGGQAEVLIREQPLYRPLFYRTESLWFDNESAGFKESTGGRIVRRENLVLDGNGKAQIVLHTPRFATSDLAYHIEARVTDASRREVVGQANVRVGQQRFAVAVNPEHRLHRPGEMVAVVFQARDINGQPAAAEGIVTVTREIWRESFLDARGRSVTASQAKAHPEGGPYRLKRRGYEREEILKRTVQTDPVRGEGRLTFMAPKEGFYRIVWVTPEPNRNPITAEATVWVSTTATEDTGYLAADLDIIADRDTLAVGRTFPVMLVAPTSGRTVWLSIIRDGLDEMRVIHLTGTTKLIELEITDRDTPNIHLEADSLLDLRWSHIRREFTVPPTAQVMDVELKADRTTVLPRESVTFTLLTRDAAGRPLPAEVALAVTDDAVSAIQTDYAPDPRRFFYGNRRRPYVNTSTSLQYRPYVQLKPQLLAEEDGQAVRTEEGAHALVGNAKAVPEGVAPMEQSDASLPGPVKRAASRDDKGQAADAGGDSGGQVIVRSDIRATAFWQPDIVTGPNGQATVTVIFPDALTTWKALARAVSATGEVGQTQMHTVTNQPLIVRLQTPRFLVVGDQTTFSAIVNNRTDRPLTAVVTLGAEGIALDAAQRTRQVTVAPNSDGRATWEVRVEQPGDVRLTVTAVAGEHRDATARTVKAYVRGIETLMTQSAQVRQSEEQLQLELPRERDDTHLVIQVAPSLAATMLDALPYLFDYPYGCTEQTMSRFLPAAITVKTLREQGVAPAAIAGRMFGGIEAATADKTHPQGRRNLDELDRIIRQGLNQLYAAQRPDGGWGWWKETPTDRFMTAYVVWGLALARQALPEVRNDVLTRGMTYLEQQLVAEEAAPDRQAWLLHALAEARHAQGKTSITPLEQMALDNLWQQRDRLTAYGRALYAMATYHYGMRERMQVLARNLANGVTRDTLPNSNLPTARWGAGGFWYRWTDSPVETTAFVLRALVRIAPDNELITPAMNWLVKNRRGAQWSNTRDTSIALLALHDYLRATGETAEPVAFEVIVNGVPVAQQRLEPGAELMAPGQFVVPTAVLRDGVNDIRILKRQGKALYVTASARFFRREAPIPPAGNEIYVKRQYWRLVPRPTLLRGVVYERLALADGEPVASGERLLCTLTIEAKNDYAYLVFEDLKPAGFEAVQLRSGVGLTIREVHPQTLELTGRSQAVYQELRDRRVALFVEQLPQGVWQMEYELRAETPGRFVALPTLGHAMYVPEIRANSAEAQVVVGDSPPATARLTVRNP
ncbi:MAG: alpha-2-macroglobulin family protein [Acidobacteriota bacterium]